MKTPTHKEYLQQRNRLGTVSRKTTGEAYLFLKRYSRKTSPLILIQVQSSNISSVSIGVLYLICEISQWSTYNKKYCYCDETNQGPQCRSDRTKENQETGTRWAGPQTLIVRHQPHETDWGGSRHLVWWPSHRRAIKEGSNIINHNWVRNHACRLPQELFATDYTCCNPSKHFFINL